MERTPRAQGLRVVVTGGGSGIGAAMATAMAAEGAQVVINDLDAGRAVSVAASVGGWAVPGDAASDQGAAALVAAARERLGEIDLFCANAGIGAAGGPQTPDEDWDAAWQVNVMGHVHAARYLLPRWLETGRGHFLATVSAAGLLTMPGSAPYSVTKHAALAFAEWMSITYRDRGVVVQALCPQGVRTPLLAATGVVGAAVLEKGAISAEEVAEAVLASLDDGRFLILPHPEVAGFYAGRAADPDGWQGAMRKVQAKLNVVQARDA